MKNFIFILFLFISCSLSAQHHVCSLCDSLEKTSSYRKNPAYISNCTITDTLDEKDKYSVKVKFICSDRVEYDLYLKEGNKLMISYRVTNGDTLYSIVESDAKFKGGQPAMIEYLRQSIVYPKSAMRKGYEGKSIIYFEIGKQGEILNARVIKGFNAECDAEALRVVKQMPDWIPAMIDGIPVRSRALIPISFKIKD